MTKINIKHVQNTVIGWKNELLIAQQEKALTKEQFDYAVKLKSPELEQRRKTLMQITRKVQDIKAMIYLDHHYPDKTMNEIVQIIIKEQEAGNHV